MRRMKDIYKPVSVIGQESEIIIWISEGKIPRKSTLKERKYEGVRFYSETKWVEHCDRGKASEEIHNYK